MVNNWSLVAIYVVQETLFKIIIKNGLVSAFLEDFIYFKKSLYRSVKIEFYKRIS